MPKALSLDSQSTFESTTTSKQTEVSFVVNGRNVALIVAIPVLTATAFILPIQFLSRLLSVLSFTHVALVLNVGVAWTHCYGLVQRLCFVRDPQKQSEKGEETQGERHCDFLLTLFYQVGSVLLAVSACHFALHTLSYTCAQVVEAANIRECETRDCRFLYLTSVASLYWFVAEPIVGVSLALFTRLAQKASDLPEDADTTRILDV